MYNYSKFKKKNQTRKFIFGAVFIALLGAGLYFIPPIHDKLYWRLDEWRVRLVYFFRPPQEVAFHPGGQVVPTTTANAPIATQSAITPTWTPIPTDQATATVTPTPPPASVVLDKVIYVDQMGRYNYCGPSNLAMAVEYWGWKGEEGMSMYEIRDQIGLAIKPGMDEQGMNFVERGNSDVNVMPYEMVDYVNERTDLKALFRYGGDENLLKRLIAAGFPVITEKGIYEPLLPDNSIQWGGHYSFTTGYDDAAGVFVWQDSYLPKADYVGRNSRTPYADYMSYWRSFNYVFIVVYPPEREAELQQVLGPWNDEYWAAQHALDIADQELASGTLTGNDKFFAMFNRVTSLVNLRNPDYGPAAAAFDEANAFYNTLPQDHLLPYRIMWYQTAPYSAYYYSGRYQDVIDLAHIYLTERLIKPRSLEESWFWMARAEYALGEFEKAYADMRRALYYHPGFQPALDMFSLWGVTP